MGDESLQTCQFMNMLGKSKIGSFSSVGGWLVLALPVMKISNIWLVIAFYIISLSDCIDFSH